MKGQKAILESLRKKFYVPVMQAGSNDIVQKFTLFPWHRRYILFQKLDEAGIFRSVLLLTSFWNFGFHKSTYTDYDGYTDTVYTLGLGYAGIVTTVSNMQCSWLKQPVVEYLKRYV